MSEYDPSTSKSKKIKSMLISAASPFIKTPKSPDKEFGELFSAIHASKLFRDGKEFVDLVPRYRSGQINRSYKRQKNEVGFSLKDFVNKNFYKQTSSSFGSSSRYTKASPEDRIRALWRDLEYENLKNIGSLIALPYPYIVPGGRFKEQFYWDSYFIMLGLAVDNRWNMINGMLKNITYMLRKYKFVPNANRSYLLSRSQPPFLSHMVRLVAAHEGKAVLVRYLPYLLMEYSFWMKGSKRLFFGKRLALNRVVRMSNDSILNRYYDKRSTPRGETYSRDLEMGNTIISQESDNIYLHLRAAAESGWDFSSRWFDNEEDIKTIKTIDIVPIDLNCLLYDLESTIAEAYGILKQTLFSKKYKKLADRRRQVIQNYLWDEQNGFYFDYDFQAKKRTERFTLAAVFPLYSKLASQQQADLIARRLEHDFLKKGGLVTTLIKSGQQWDSPNGWAPLHWIAIKGLRNYGYDDLANEIKKRWITTNLDYFASHGKFVEKYNVINPEAVAEDGEYNNQDGFGWTNGVLICLIRDEDCNL